MPAEAILARFRNGDPEAFAQVVRECGAVVRAVTRRFTPSAFEQEEMMQEVWMHVFSQRDALDPGRADAFRGWLAVVARNKCIELQRRSGRAAVEIPDEDLERLADPEGTPAAAAAEQRELIAALDAFKKKLKPQWRSFFELHFVQGLDYETITTRLGISRTRCKYMKKVLATRARSNPQILEALGRTRR